MNDIFEIISQKLTLEKPPKDETILLEHCTLPLDLSLITPLSPVKERQILFVDGGNGEIYSTANTSLQLIRLYASLYAGAKRIQTFRAEFFALVTLTQKSGTLTYTTETISQEPINFLSKLNLTIDSQDETLRTGKHRIKPSIIGEHIRKLAELAFIEELLYKVQNNTILCRDGDLISTRTHEKEFLNRIKEIARQKSHSILGLSKTTHILTSSGQSISIILDETKSQAPWYYKTGINEPWTTFAKLNRLSNYVFRIDCLFANKDTIAALIEHSSDLSFPGYPYGLIEADHFARVTRVETKIIQQVLLARTPHLANFTKSVDAHDNL